MLFYHRFAPDNNYIYNMTIGKALDSHSDEYKKYYANFEANRVMGVECNYFVTQNFDVTLAFFSDSINYRNYDMNNIFTRNFIGRIILEYNF